MSICNVYPLPYRPDPAHYFAALRTAPGAVLLDAGWPNAERGRFDVMSAWPQRELLPQPDGSFCSDCVRP
jgi:para-aminobenzoate synthetase component 1